MGLDKKSLTVNLEGVTTSHSPRVREVKAPLFLSDGVAVNEREYSLTVPGVGDFYACDGSEAEYSPLPGADLQWVNLYLNSQVLVALLHQRKMMSFHAGSFLFRGRGVMVAGSTGAGKSSLTLAFALGAEQSNNMLLSAGASRKTIPDDHSPAGGFSLPPSAGASRKTMPDDHFHAGGFLTDDLTPVLFPGTPTQSDDPTPFILPLGRKVKIRRDTVTQLAIDPSLLTHAEQGTGKLYLTLPPALPGPHPLDLILHIEAGPVAAPLFSSPPPAERFALLRSEICSHELLAGMPETEKAYLPQLAALVEKTEFIKVVRPTDIALRDFYATVRQELLKRLTPAG